MHRLAVWLGVLIVVALTLVVLFDVAPWSDAAGGPVYTPSAIQAGIARDPHAWLGHTLRVRGSPISIATGCPANYNSTCDPSALMELALQDYGREFGSTGTLLPVVLGRPNPLLALSRRVPFLNALLPAPQQILYAGPAIYRVRLQAAACRFALHPVCYQAVLLDAAPPVSVSMRALERT